MSVVKLDGRKELFSVTKLGESVSRAAADVGVEVNGAVEVSVDRDVGTWELADMVQLELLRRAIDKPELALVAKSHLLGRIYKETFGKDFLKDKAGYRERAVARFKSLIEAGLLKPEAIEALSAFEPRPDFDRSLSYNALRLFTNGNYALRDQNFRLAETPSMVAWRVATAVARELERAKLYYDYITQLKIVPASPFWFNAWTGKEMFASCFTLEVEDCLSSITHPGRYCIYDALAYSGIIQQLGGGVGYDFSLLRPEGDVVRGSVGVASGPVSFMRLFDANVDVIKQGGKRRGAQMGTLHVWHPDIRKFIKAKTGELKDAHLQNFNISVFVDDTFMEKALGIDQNPKYKLINPRAFVEKFGVRPVEYVDIHRQVLLPSEVVWDEVDVRELFKEIAHGAWDSGDPGMIFKSNLNASNPLLGVEIEVAGYKTRYTYRAVNPCSEIVMSPFEVCNLTHINLVKFVKDNCGGGSFEEKLGCIDWESLAQAIRVAVRFLDDAIERSRTGIEVVDAMNRSTRRIGVGIMGVAELLIKLGIPYASWEAVELINRIMGWIYVNALDESAELAREKGPFRFFHKSIYAKGEIPVLKYQDYVWSRWERIKGVYPHELQIAGDRLYNITMRTRQWLRSHLERLSEKVRGGVRNLAVLTVAPTGRTSILAGTTSGVEPVFALAFLRNVTVGTLIEYYWPGVEWLKKRGLWTPEVRRVVEE
ncbi:MAG: adenosylcobalamin-dependent ribonucleoside-diphosphate reductase, partial [Desulfurococcaceae archaeon]